MRKPIYAMLALTLASASGLAASGEGKIFGARDPRTCASQKAPAKGALSAEQAKQYFICDNEHVTRSGSFGDLLFLVTDVNIEIGKGRAFNPATDSFNTIDPSELVYPIRGGYVGYQCGVVGSINSAPGKNCAKSEAPKVSGSCYKDTFGDWHCNLCCVMGSSQKPGFAPPTGQ